MQGDPRYTLCIIFTFYLTCVQYHLIRADVPRPPYALHSINILYYYILEQSGTWTFCLSENDMSCKSDRFPLLAKTNAFLICPCQGLRSHVALSTWRHRTTVTEQRTAEQSRAEELCKTELTRLSFALLHLPRALI